MAKSYKVGQQLKVNNLKVVVTAVDPKTGAATINYASGSGKQVSLVLCKVQET